jgi:hypothetical protein
MVFFLPQAKYRMIIFIIGLFRVDVELRRKSGWSGKGKRCHKCSQWKWRRRMIYLEKWRENGIHESCSDS